MTSPSPSTSGTILRRHGFRSSRLIFRAVEARTDDSFILQLQQSSPSYHAYTCVLPNPRNSNSAENYRKDLENDRFLSVIICLPREGASVEAGPEPSSANATAGTPTSTPPSIADVTVPIGVLTLSRATPSKQHNRRGEIGLIILDEHQRKGYGSEAIRWALQWGFETAGLHRVGIECNAWSEGLLRLYRSIGFRLEGSLRDFYWHEGKWWDCHKLGMLEEEWREIRGATADWRPAE